MTDNELDLSDLSTGKLLHLAQIIARQLESRIRTAEDYGYQQLRNLMCRLEGIVDNVDDAELDELVDGAIVRLEGKLPEGISGRHLRMVPFGVGYQAGVLDELQERSSKMLGSSDQPDTALRGTSAGEWTGKLMSRDDS